jgi:hypothetical protein
MEGPRSHFHIVGLSNDAAALAPETLQPEDEFLKSARRVRAERLPWT